MVALRATLRRSRSGSDLHQHRSVHPRRRAALARRRDDSGSRAGPAPGHGRVHGGAGDARVHQRCRRNGRPAGSAITELSGYATLVVEGDDGGHTIGGWGAVFEDIEAEVITIEGIEFPELE
ncbi:TrmB family transcriptional regulator sugar-binding domain-containing protein [Halosolutus gelatinilyticus]|uniref:TrmB family transcriptional regulator sugar-binding domain-containing protein n=1 Tax=Halosolutus gelatinilyticus TaxID=2931975 RepID=UPI003CE51488